MSPSNAVQNNNRLFPPFARKLAQNDPAVYTTFADRLARWLASEKAYYPAARPEIVNLLLTAHATLRRAVGADLNSNVPFHISTCIGHPMTAPYARLLKAVHPHRDLFVESGLRDSIRRLLSTVSVPSDVSAGPLHEAALPKVPISPANSQTPPMQFSSSSLASALEMRPSPASNVLFPASVSQSLSQTSIAGGDSISSSNFSLPPYDTIPTSSQATQLVRSAASAVSETKQNLIALPGLDSAGPIVGYPGENNSISAASRKRKKAKFELASLVAKDLEELSRKRGVKQEPVEEADSLLEMPSLNGAPVFTSLPTRGTSADSPSTHLADTQTSGVLSMNASGNTKPDSPYAMDLETEPPVPSSIPTDQPRHVGHSTEVTSVLAVSGSTSISPYVPDMLDGTEYPQAQRSREEASDLGFGSTPPSDVDMADGTSLIPEVQAEHMAVSADILEGRSENGCSTRVDTRDKGLAQDPPSADGQPAEIAERERFTSTTDIGSEALVPSLPSSLNTTLSSTVPDSFKTGMPVASTSPVPRYEDWRSETELVVPSSTSEKDVRRGLEVGSSTIGLNPKSSSASQGRGVVNEGITEGITPADTSGSVQSSFDCGPQAPTVIYSSSPIDNTTHPPPGAENSLESAMPMAKRGTSLTPILNTKASPPSATSKQTPQINTVQLDFQKPPSTADLAMSLTQKVVPDVFRGKMRILANHRGVSNNNKITLLFDISEEQLQALQMWNNRRNVTEGLQESLCVSLACYTAAKRERNTVDQLFALPACWPKIGGLTMVVLYKGRREEFPLSPPFMVATDGLVDVSEFLTLGCNIIELSHRVDTSGYIFVLRAHSPTSVQLEEVAQRQRKKQEWKEWLQHVSRPLNVPRPPFA